tara:strand:- start:11 stop:421 length:411 start_codon:yes stop_codon:yes gene_type:complete
MNYRESYIAEILKEVKTIAIIGASAKKNRDSFKVMQALIEYGYEVFPVNPNEEGNLILQKVCYKDLKSIKKKIDMVNIFRAPDAIMNIAEQSIENKVKVFWTQLGIINEEAAKLAQNAGLKVVMDRCSKMELDKSN